MSLDWNLFPRFYIMCMKTGIRKYRWQLCQKIHNFLNREFGQIAMDLLEISSERDVVKLRELLIAGNTLSETHSVLGLAELAGHEEFIAHPSCQRVLDDAHFRWRFLMRRLRSY